MFDLPPTNDEILSEAERRQVADGDAAYKAFQAAQKAGGPCTVCGWRDGDGVKVCFYSKELGAVTHQNTARGAERTMTPAQISLYRLRTGLLCRDAKAREAYIAHLLEDQRARRARWEGDSRNEGIPFCADGNNTPMTDEQWIARRRAQIEREPLACDAPYRDWIQKPSYDQWHVMCYEPHPDCGGVQIGLGPYHIACTGCDTEVRLWEHGIDYDIG